MSFTFSDFKLRFPELAGVDESFYNQAKAAAVLRVNVNVWCDKADEAIKLLTAHIIALSGRGGAAGQVKRERVGDLEREYGVSSSGTGATTSYKQEFDDMMKETVIPAYMIC